ncbi:TPA: hypothetical protein NGT02_004521 [Vibrio parahaemolyticus]|nr:hypothetical protein [Vibrio parahaemolyticus]
MRHWALQELAVAALGMTEEQYEEVLNGDEDFDTPLHEKFGVDFDQFSQVAEALLKLTPVVTKGISKENVHAFVKLEEGHGTIIIESPYKPQ